MSEILTNEKIAEIRARADRATPGPWENPGMATIALTFDSECNIYPPDTMKSHGFQYGGPVAVAKYRGECDSNPDGSDADFIAHARTDIPALCDSHDAQAQRIAELELCLEPGKASAIVGGMFDLAKRKCGYMPTAKHGLTFIEEELDRRAAEIATLKAKLAEAEKDTAGLKRHLKREFVVQSDVSDAAIGAASETVKGI